MTFPSPQNTRALLNYHFVPLEINWNLITLATMLLFELAFLFLSVFLIFNIFIFN